MLSIFRLLLFPFSLIYGTIVACRRKAYQKGWLRSKTFSVPTICVGNLRMGGTGKTPHVEYIVNFLTQNHQIAILSRGYGRKTKGYINITDTLNPSSEMVGDEPMQYAAKFPKLKVSVCEKRKTGIENLLSKNPNLEAIILDDAYQHLAVNCSISILLTEYDRPFFEDFPLPAGNLREFRCAAKYADIIIVTKCPDDVTETQKTHFLQKLRPKKDQEVVFTKINYKQKVGGTADAEGGQGSKEVFEGRGRLYQNQKLLLITGIANPQPLVQYLKPQFNEFHHLHFPDHHAFTKKDIEKIILFKEKLGGENCTILTTEKDATRLQAFENMPEYQTIPIEIVFLENEAVFKEKLLSLLKSS